MLVGRMRMSSFGLTSVFFTSWLLSTLAHRMGRTERMALDKAVDSGIEAYEASRFAEAATHYRKAVDLLPGSSLYWRMLGDATLHLPGGASEAVVQYNAAVAADPNDFDARVAAGTATLDIGLGANGDSLTAAAAKVAEPHFWKMAELRPQSPTALTDVGIFFMNHAGDLAEAEPFLRRALALAARPSGSLEPPSAAHRLASVHLSYLLAAKGQVAEALQHYGRGCPDNVCPAGGLPLSADGLEPLLRSSAGSDQYRAAQVVETKVNDKAAVVQTFSGMLPPTVVDAVRVGLRPASPFWAVNYNGKFRSYYLPLSQLPQAGTVPPTVPQESIMGGVIGQTVSLLMQGLSANAAPGSALANLASDAVGAEIWGHAKAYRRQQVVIGGHQLHYDEDHTYHSRSKIWRHPIATVILYLSQSGIGGPLVVANRTRRTPAMVIGDSTVETAGWLVQPQPGLVAGFVGDRLHGVLPGFGTAANSLNATGEDAHRVSLNVAFWRRGEACIATYEECQRRPPKGFVWEGAMPPVPLKEHYKSNVERLHVQAVKHLFLDNGRAGHRHQLSKSTTKKGRRTPTAWEF